MIPTASQARLGRDCAGIDVAHVRQPCQRRAVEQFLFKQPEGAGNPGPSHGRQAVQAGAAAESTMSTSTIEEVAAASGKPFWFQLYLMKQREANESLIRRAHDAGCVGINDDLPNDLDRDARARRVSPGLWASMHRELIGGLVGAAAVLMPGRRSARRR